MQELAPFGVWLRGRGGFCRDRRVDKLENKWPARYDPLSSRKKVPPDDTVFGCQLPSHAHIEYVRLQDTGLSS